MPIFQYQYIHMCILEAYLLCSLSSFAEKTSEEIGLPKVLAFCVELAESVALISVFDK